MKLFHVIKKEYFFLSLLFLTGFLLRTYNLSGIPTGIHGDEASIGYNAFSLLKTGKDQNGNFLPIAIDQFGDFRPAGYHYIDIPFVALFGLNELAVRLPSAIFGAGSIIIFFFLLKELFANKKMPFIGSFLLTVSPWHIVISRSTSESIIAGFFILIGTLFLIKSIKSEKSLKNFSLTFIFFFLSFLFYHSARLFIPLFLITSLIFLLLEAKTDKRKIISSFLFYIFLISSLFLIFTFGKGENRPLNVSILNLPGGTKELKQQQDEDGVQNPLLTRFYHNKLYFYGRAFLTFYFQHLSGEFLFVNNGNPIRYKVPWTGNVYPIEAPFILFGFSVLLAEGIKSKKFIYLIPISWLFIGALPGGLTWEDTPNIQRSSLMIPALIMFSAFGITELFKIKNNKTKTIISLAVGLILVQNIIYFFHNYFYHSKIHEPWHRSAFEKELILNINDLSKKYNKVIMTTQSNNNFIFYLFYNKFDPKTFQDMGSPREKDGLIFKNIAYTYNSCPINGNPDESALGNRNIIFVNKIDCQLPKNAEILNTIRTPDGIPFFNIIRLIDLKE